MTTTPTPTGRIFGTDEGRDLVLERTFRAPIGDVWASITESERTARWFASWTGEPGAGSTIRYRMDFEEGQPEGQLLIVACEAPVHLAVQGADEGGGWRLDARLSEADGTTTLRFTHHLDAGDDPAMIGPGWEYYLDLLVSSRDGSPSPEFDDYYPAQADHYASLPITPVVPN